MGGYFATLGGQTRSRIGRLSSTTAALQQLNVSPDGSSVTWQRSGTGPEVWRATFELSTDGVTYLPLGAGTRTAGGWRVDGLSLPVGQNFLVRARGYYTSGQFGGSASIVESVRNAYIHPQARAITSSDRAVFVVGDARSFAVTTTGLPRPTITRSGALPAGVTFTDDCNGAATVAGTPAAGTGGEYRLTITAANGVQPYAVQSLVVNVGQMAVITSAAATTFRVGLAGSFTITTTGYPTSAILCAGSLPKGVTFTDNRDGTATIAGVPAAGTAGVNSLVISASNGMLTAEQAFRLIVRDGAFLPLLLRSPG